MMVLLVEDHAAEREALVRLLHLRGVETITARTAEEAMMLVGDFPFDVVISDLVLPDQSGFELMTYLRENHPTLPAIAVSAHLTPSVEADSLAAGFSTYFHKPVDVDLLVIALRRVRV